MFCYPWQSLCMKMVGYVMNDLETVQNHKFESTHNPVLQLLQLIQCFSDRLDGQRAFNVPFLRGSKQNYTAMQCRIGLDSQRLSLTCKIQTLHVTAKERGRKQIKNCMKTNSLVGPLIMLQTKILIVVLNYCSHVLPLNSRGKGYQ